MTKKTIKSKAYNSDSTNLPLTEYYDSLATATRVVRMSPKEEFLSDISKITGRTPETVRRWCLGDATPALHIQKKIARHFKTKPEILFPE